MLTVARYRPENETEPTFQSYDVPYRQDWVVLDALNYVKDHIDGSLSFRWSCRMGVCGSCGMMVNGTPKLTCAVPLSDYVSKPIRIEPLQFFPILRDLIVDISSFLGKLSSVKPWIIRDDATPSTEAEYLSNARRAGGLQAVPACASIACCAIPHVLSSGSNPSLPDQPPSPLRSATTWIRETKARPSDWPFLDDHEGMWGCTFVGECTKVMSQERRPGRCDPTVQSRQRDELVQVHSVAAGFAVNDVAQHSLARSDPLPSTDVAVVVA